MIARRHFLTLTGGLLLAPLAGCGRQGHWPEGMAEIKWDRDTCVRCSMVISDRRFAAEMRGGEKNTVFKFDDISCLEQFRAQRPDQKVAAVFVKEYETKDWLRLEGAVIVETGVSTPMGSGKVAFRDSTRAREFLVKNPVSQ